MRQINKITQTKKYPDLYLVVFDNDDEVYISFEDLIGSKLTKGASITDELFENLIKKSEYCTVRSTLIRKTLLKDYGTKEIETYLYRKNIDKELVQTLIEEMISRNLINNSRVAEKLINRAKISTKPKSFNSIKYELRQKGVDESEIERLGNDYQPNNLEEYAKKYASKSSIKNSPNWKLKLIRHLAGKGFEYNEILAVVDSLFTDQ